MSAAWSATYSITKSQPPPTKAKKPKGDHSADKKKVKNIDLWLRIEAAAKPHQVQWFWVKGHAGHAENERADALARKGLSEARTGNTKNSAGSAGS